MYEGRSFRRVARVAAAALPLAFVLSATSLGCATGTSESDDDGGGSSGDFDGQPGMETGPRHEGGGHDSGEPDDGVDTGKGMDGGMDSGVKDAGHDGTKPPDDTGAKDAGHDSGSCVAVTVSDAGAAPSACPATGVACGDLVSTSGFSPTWVPPATPTTSCTTAQIDTIYNDCLNPKTETTAKCTAIQTTDKTCYDCIFTAEGASTYGPVVDSTNGGLVFVNQAGCIDLLEPCNLDCADAFQAALQCEDVACETNCPTITTTAQDTAYEDCIDTAAVCDPNGCASYTDEANNCGALLTGAKHPASKCVATAKSTFATLFKAIVPVFCGP